MSGDSSLPFTIGADGLRLAVRLTPRAKRNEIAGLVDAGGGRTALAVRLAAPPVEGAANRTLVELLARILAIPKSAITIFSGEKSRLQTVLIAGADAATMTRLLSPRSDENA